MNINEYKDFMDSILVKKFTVEELELKLKHNRNRRKAAVITLAIVVSLAIILVPALSSPIKDSLVITVYGSDGRKVILSKHQVNYTLDLLPLNVAYFEGSGDGSVNTELVFEFEGKDLDSIVVSCSNNIIKRNDLSKVDAYFIQYEEIEKSVYDRNRKKIESSEEFLGCIRNEKSVTVMSLVGNSYEICYDVQITQKYGLTMNVKRGDDEKFAIKGLVLDLKINYLDGTSQNEKIKIDATENVLSGINIQLL